MAYPPPLFILSPPRSFTSVTCGVIGQHPEIFGCPELNLFHDETIEELCTGTKKDGTGRSPFWGNVHLDGILRTVAQLYAGEQTLESIEMAKRWLQVRAKHTTTAVHQELCEKVSPLILLDKTPAYVRRSSYLKRLNAAFPDARFIHLVRHPRGQCESVLAARVGPMAAFFMGLVDSNDKEAFVDPQRAWFDSHIRAMKFLSEIPRSRWIRVKGEDFMRDIEGVAVEICTWLGISTSPEAIEAMKHPENSPFACVGPATARFGNDPKFLTSPALRPTNVKDYDFEEPLPWRPDNAVFSEPVQALARSFGYA